MSPAERNRGIRLSVGTFAASWLVTLATSWGIATTAGGPRTVVQVLTRWDAGFFLAIAEHGYPAQLPAGTGPGAQSVLAFFPGYPLLIKGASAVPGVSPTAAGMIISTLGGAAACAVVWMLAARLSEPATATRTVALFAFFPSAFVLSMVYSDSLFVLLSAACLLALVDGRWLLAGICAALAGGVRPTGLVLLPVCALAAFVSIRSTRAWKPVVAPLLAPLGITAFLGFLEWRTGTWLTFLRAQDRGWGQRFDFGWSNLQEVIDLLLDPRISFHLVVLALFAVGSLVAVWMMRRWRPPIPITTYVIGTLVLAFGITITTSVPRLLLGAFPLLIPVARSVDRWGFVALLSISAALMVVYFVITSTTRLAP